MRPVTLDDTISLYEGLIVRDRKQVILARGGYPPEEERLQKNLAQDKLILGALKCAQAHGYSGEE